LLHTKPSHPDHRPGATPDQCAYPDQQHQQQLQQCPRSHLAGPQLQHCSSSSSCCSPSPSPTRAVAPALNTPCCCAEGLLSGFVLKALYAFCMCGLVTFLAVAQIRCVCLCYPRHHRYVWLPRVQAFICRPHSPACAASGGSSSRDGRRAWWLCRCWPALATLCSFPVLALLHPQQANHRHTQRVHVHFCNTHTFCPKGLAAMSGGMTCYFHCYC
jgi:hypothetical protein